jgi:hypothetical protein
MAGRERMVCETGRSHPKTAMICLVSGLLCWHFPNSYRYQGTFDRAIPADFAPLDGAWLCFRLGLRLKGV